MNDKKWWSEKEAQEKYGYSLAWWRRYRWKGGGVPYVKLNNGRVAYKPEDLEQYFNRFQTCNSTADYNRSKNVSKKIKSLPI